MLAIHYATLILPLYTLRRSLSLLAFSPSSSLRYHTLHIERYMLRAATLPRCCYADVMLRYYYGQIHDDDGDKPLRYILLLARASRHITYAIRHIQKALILPLFTYEEIRAFSAFFFSVTYCHYATFLFSAIRRRVLLVYIARYITLLIRHYAARCR